MPAETLELIAFCSVVRHASFAKASEGLALSPSGVSKIVSRLEERLGARLLERTTRSLSLTEAGAAFYARATRILADLADAEAEASASARRPRGTLRLSAPVAFGRLHLAPLLEGWLRRFPELAIDLTLTDRFVDLVDQGVDLAVRIGALPDSTLVARRLCANRRVLVASPAYLARRGRPESVADLSAHECLLFTANGRSQKWRLVGPGGPAVVEVGGRLRSNNAEALLQAARQGCGIARAATFAAAGALAAGELERVLAPYEFEPTSVFAVYPPARPPPGKVRAVVDELARAFRDPPAWDAAPAHS